MSDKDRKKRIRDAVNDPSLKTALDRAAVSYAKARAEAFDGFDFEELRTHLRECKEASTERIRELFEQFRHEAERVGAQVHEASDADDASRIVLEIAAAHGVCKIAKAKSMLTEEIELNRHLINAGLQVTETDLGEWILQIAGERPSHFTAPAIHKTREEVAELISRFTGEKVESDISSLVEIARREIRHAFLEADMGISGANIAIADTGTLVLVSNEGNARLVTSLPEVHVALVGYEKLVPSLDEATAVIKLLSKSGTGQRMTSYVSFITGPSRTSDIEKTLTLGCHGPREVHIIFVDNGRLSMLDDPEFREALYCIKCGACLNVCPVYRSVGGHVFGHTYVGGIGTILTAFHAGMIDAEEIAGICSTCGRCGSYCPVKMDIPRMVVGLRRKCVEAHGLPLIERLAMETILARPDRFDAAMRVARPLQKIFSPDGELPFPLSGLTRFRKLPEIAEKPLRQRITDDPPPKPEKRIGTVAFFPGCVIDYVYPEIGEAVMSVLARLGWEVLLPKGQGCCGIPALLKGDAETARKLAKHNIGIRDFESADYVITACPTCTTTLKNEFTRLLGSGSPEGEAASRLAAKVHDFSEFLVNIVGVTADDFEDARSHRKATYHDPCHARHGQGILREPRELLRLAGYEVVEMPEPDACCGFAGSYSVTYPEVSESILKRKIENILSTGASTIATDCPGCLIQLRGGLEKASHDLHIVHTAELLADAVRDVIVMREA